MDKSVLITLIIVGGILLLGAMAFIFANSTLYAQKVTSTGTATIKVIPDLAVVYFNIQTNGKTSQEADDSNSKIYDDMKISLLNLGFEEEKIQTQSYSVYPEYDWQTGQQKLKEYVAVHSVKIEIEISDKEKISDTIDAGIDAGAGVGYINYEITSENQNKYKTEAIKKATEDSRTKAEALAEGAGRELGKLVSISTSDFGYSPWLAYSAEGASVSKSDSAQIESSIAPSEQEVSSSVTAVFKIK